MPLLCLSVLSLKRSSWLRMRTAEFTVESSGCGHFCWKCAIVRLVELIDQWDWLFLASSCIRETDRWNFPLRRRSAPTMCMLRWWRPFSHACSVQGEHFSICQWIPSARHGFVFWHFEATLASDQLCGQLPIHGSANNAAETANSEKPAKRL